MITTDELKEKLKFLDQNFSFEIVEQPIYDKEKKTTLVIVNPKDCSFIIDYDFYRLENELKKIGFKLFSIRARRNEQLLLKYEMV